MSRRDTSAELGRLRTELADAVRRAERAEAMVPPLPKARSQLLEAAAEEVQRSERLMRAVFSGASDAMVFLDDDGHFIDVNPAACTLFGLTRARLLRGHVGTSVEDPEAMVSAFRAMREAGQASGRAMFVRPNGERRITEFTGTANIGAHLHLLLVHDITVTSATAQSLTRAELELRRHGARFRALVEKSAEAMALLSTSGVFIYVSRHSTDILGVPPEDLVGARALDLVYPEDRATMTHAIEQAVATGASTVVARLLHSDGSHRWLETITTNLVDDPDIGSLVLNVRDITAIRVAAREREHLVESLSFERRRLGTVLEKAPWFMAVLRGEEHVFELANEAHGALVGRPDVIGQPFADALPELAAQGFDGVLDKVLQTGEPFIANELSVELSRGARGSSETRIMNIVVQALGEADGTRSGVCVHGIDVTDETLAKRRAHALFNGVPVPTYAWQRVQAAGLMDFILLDYNEAAKASSEGRIVAFRERSVRDVFPADVDAFADLERCLEGGETFQREVERPMTGAQSTRYLVTYAPAPPDVVLAHTQDVTEQRKLEGQLRQAQKMEAVGRLAGGVAHDFNNLLSIVLSYASLIVEDLGRDHPLCTDAEQIQAAGQRAVELTRQLLAFSRQQVLQPRVMSIGETVTGLEKMLTRLLGEDVELVLHAPAGGNVEADGGQIEQVIMNLVINARDAMPEGGRLVVRTEDVDVVEALVTEQTTTPPGKYVMLAVSDTGIGMDTATRARVFEPFFTTKGPGKGTGLGLATVFGIVQQSGGSIQVDSEPGRGTTFRVYFPRTSARSDRRTVTSGPRTVCTGNETILVVEDEAPLRALVVAVLRRAGYTVLDASDGESAVTVAERCGTDIDILITDVVMPRLNGRQLADRLAASRPGMRLLFMSGYTDDAVVLQRVLASKAAFLQKPITPDALLEKVREVLDAKASS